MVKQLFVAATGQHKGKTTCTLGLVAAIRDMNIDVGYCKPVGQKHLIVEGRMMDKDAILFEDMLDFEVVPATHSPVIIASGVTAQFSSDPSRFSFREDIVAAAHQLREQHEMVVYEGTGHVGVGSVIELSNAQVAKLLGAEVILIAEGGIGRTFDRLNLNLALFREQGVPIKGVIINKVHADKQEHVREHLTAYLKKIGIPLLGVLPFDRTLSFPLMATIKRTIEGETVWNEHRLNNQVEEILAGSLIEIDEFTYFRNLLLITNPTNLWAAIEKIRCHAEQRGLTDSPLSGVIITGVSAEEAANAENFKQHSYLAQHEVPVLRTPLETYDTVVAISRIEVKINTSTPWKIKRAVELIKENIDVAKLIN